MANVYFAQPPGAGPLSYEMWDGFAYGDANGENIDLERLAEGRRNTFTDSLFGVSEQSDGYLVLYQTEDGLRGVVISNDLRSARLPHANYRMPAQVTRISERNLNCDGQ